LNDQSSLQEKVAQLKDLNQEVYSSVVKNPYLRLFFMIMIENKVFRALSSDFVKDYVINLFDYVALCCKFLSRKDLPKVINWKIDHGIAEGNLEVIPLIGLKSPRLGQLLQNYVD